MAHPILQYPSSLGTAFGKTTISNGGSGYTAGATSIVVADGSVFPATGLFWVGVGNSDPPVFTKRCTARSGNTLTVDSAASDGTTDTSEADGVAVQWVLTPASLDQLQADQYRSMTVADFDALAAAEYRNGYTIRLSNGIYTVTRQGGAWEYYYGSHLISRPPSAGWTSDNFNASSTIDSTNGYEFLTLATQANMQIRYRTAPASPYTVKAIIMLQGSTSSHGGGIFFRESGTGKIIRFSVGLDSGPNFETALQKWTNTSTFSANYTLAAAQNQVNWVAPLYIWMWMDDGVTSAGNLTWKLSKDGFHWIQWDQRSRTDFMAGGPDQIAFGGNADGGATGVALISWSAA